MESISAQKSGLDLLDGVETVVGDMVYVGMSFVFGTGNRPNTPTISKHADFFADVLEVVSASFDPGGFNSVDAVLLMTQTSYTWRGFRDARGGVVEPDSDAYLFFFGDPRTILFKEGTKNAVSREMEIRGGGEGLRIPASVMGTAYVSVWHNCSTRLKSPRMDAHGIGEILLRRGGEEGRSRVSAHRTQRAGPNFDDEEDEEFQIPHPPHLKKQRSRLLDMDPQQFHALSPVASSRGSSGGGPRGYGSSHVE